MNAILICKDGSFMFRDVRRFGTAGRNEDLIIDRAVPECRAFAEEHDRSYRSEPRRFAFVGETAYTRTLIYEERP